MGQISTVANGIATTDAHHQAKEVGSARVHAEQTFQMAGTPSQAHPWLDNRGTISKGEASSGDLAEKSNGQSSGEDDKTDKNKVALARKG